MYPLKKQRLVSVLAAGGLGAATLAVVAGSAQAWAPVPCSVSKHSGNACVLLDDETHGLIHSVRVNGQCLLFNSGFPNHYYGKVTVPMNTTPTLQPYFEYHCEGNTNADGLGVNWSDKAGKRTNFRRVVVTLPPKTWGGYVAHGSFTSISGSWVEPRVTCNTTNDLVAPWVGISDNSGSYTIEQTGVVTACTSGRPVLSAWYEMYPALPVYWKDPVSEGDHITASVVSNGGGSYTLTLTDDTKGWSEHATQQNPNVRNVEAEAVIESPTQSYPISSRTDFSGVTVNGQPFDVYHPTVSDSHDYAVGSLSNGSFSVAPSTGSTLHVVRRNTRPKVIHFSTE